MYVHWLGSEWRVEHSLAILGLRVRYHTRVPLPVRLKMDSSDAMAIDH